MKNACVQGSVLGPAGGKDKGQLDLKRSSLPHHPFCTPQNDFIHRTDPFSILPFFHSFILSFLLTMIAATATRAVKLIPSARLRPVSGHRNSVVVRAAENSADAEAPSATNSSTVFYAGSSYTEESWAEAVKAGAVSVAPSAPAESMVAELSLGDLMAFSGPAPELINGRLAMLAFVSAFFAELSSGESVLKQWADEPTGVLLTFVLFSAASLIPMMNGANREAFGPFSPKAEELNGRAAMIGFAALLIVEGVRGGQALF